MATTNNDLFEISLFDANKNYALEASAGTGKTYSIKHIVKTLVYKYHIDLGKILIVTYTEKAAGELKSEIREILTSPLKELNGLSVVEKLAEEKVTVDCDIDNASIGTIHSFCKTIIEQYAITSNQAIGLELAGDLDINDFAKRFIREGDILKDISSILSAGQTIKEDTLINGLVAAAKKYYLDLNNNEDSRIVKFIKWFDPNNGNILPLTYDLLNSKTDVLTVLNSKPGYQNYLDAYQLLLANVALPSVQEFINDFNDFLKFCCNEKGVSFYKMPVATYPADVRDAYKLLFNLKDGVLNEKRVFLAEVFLIDKYLKDFYIAYQVHKEENRLQTFNDMIRVIREAVKDSDSTLLKVLKDKYIYGIIDEFQDTNQIQFDIFKQIFMCANHHIIVVGDPKQSIYSFQGADVTVYREAVDEIESNKTTGTKKRLGKNYRSSVGVVEFCNQLFAHYDFGFPFNTSDPCRIANNDNHEYRAKYCGNYTPGLWLNEGEIGPEDFARFAVEQILDCVSLDDTGHTKLQLYKYDIHDPSNPAVRDVDFSDFAILCKSRSELVHIKKYLRIAGIPTLVSKDDKLFAGQECAHWIALLEAIDAPDFTDYNRGYFKRALFTDFFGLSIAEIADPKYDDDSNPDVIDKMVLFREWKMIVNDRRWEDLFETIIIDTDLDTRLSSLSHMQSLAIYKQIASYAIEYLSQGLTLGDLINHLNKIVKYSNEESQGDNASIVEKSTNFKSVTIMTMHASKGLQFPVVISVGGWKGLKDSDDCYSCHQMSDQNKPELILFSNKKVAGDKWREEQEAEVLRLFYVAYTRPQYLLIAPKYGTSCKFEKLEDALNNFIDSSQTAKVEIEKGVKVPLFERKKFLNIPKSKMAEMTGETLQRNSTSIKDQNTIEQEKAAQQKVLKQLIKDRKQKVAYSHSYANLSHPTADQQLAETNDEEGIIDKEGFEETDVSDFDKAAKQIVPAGDYYDSSLGPKDIPPGYPKGTEMGNAIHETFEDIDFTKENDQVNDNIMKARYKSHGFDLAGDYYDYTKEIIRRVLKAKLPEIIGSKETGKFFELSELKYADRKAEAEFDFNYPKEILLNYFTGFIDLVFRRKVKVNDEEVDVYSVLDWKSDTINNYEFLSYSQAEELKKHVDKHYAIQRVIYSYCLIKWLKQFYPGTEDEVFNKHFGGVYYVFVRGCNDGKSNGIYAQTWNSWQDLEKALLEITQVRP